MGSKPDSPLTVTEVKERLRNLADDTDLLVWVRDNPRHAAALAVILGLLLGTSPNGRQLLLKLIGWLVPSPWPAPATTGADAEHDGRAAAALPGQLPGGFELLRSLLGGFLRSQ